VTLGSFSENLPITSKKCQYEYIFPLIKLKDHELKFKFRKAVRINCKHLQSLKYFSLITLSLAS
jgi:hypothetical protein